MSITACVQSGARKTTWYFSLLALASLIWSGQGIAVKVLDAHLGPIAITFLPFYVTTLLFVPLLLRRRRQNPGLAPPSARDWVGFTIAGVGGQMLVCRGYTALKFDPFGSAWRTLSPYEFDLSIDIIRAVRSAVGKEVDILVEGHSRFSVSTALQLANAIEPSRPLWFEEPVHHSNISAIVEVARNSPVPIATGENFSNKHQFAELLKHEVISIYQPEPLNLGGLFATRKIADAIDSHYGLVAPHSAQGPVCSAACVQLNASLPNFLIHEIFDDFNEPWEVISSFLALR